MSIKWDKLLLVKRGYLPTLSDVILSAVAWIVISVLALVGLGILFVLVSGPTNVLDALGISYPQWVRYLELSIDIILECGP